MNSISFGTIISVIGFTTLLVTLFISYLIFLLYGLGLKKMADNLNIEYSWMALIPIAHLYILSKLIVNETRIKNLDIILPIATALSLVFGLIPIVGILYYLIIEIINIIFQYKLFKVYTPKQAILMLVVSIIFPIAIPVVIFLIRNNKPTEIEFGGIPTEEVESSELNESVNEIIEENESNDKEDSIEQ